MDRRTFIGSVAGGLLVVPFAAAAQQRVTPVIGFLNGASPALYAGPLRAFRQGLSEIGYVEGQNVTIDYRWADGQYDRLPAMVADLIRRQVSVIAATSTPAALAAKAATSTIPIVFTTGSDPVQLGLVVSMSRPNGNVTGASQMTSEVESKRLELAHDLVPRATIIALLVNPGSPVVQIRLSEMQAAAGALGLKLHVLRASKERDIDDAFATAARLRAGVLVISGDVFFNTRYEQLGALTLRHALPTIYSSREFAAAGGLMSYGGSILGSYHAAGVYTGRILKGDKPGDLPVQQTTKIELIINLKTANALGITIPQSMIVRADELIQ
jgi:putative tryptophan/tyrosine transport system substrate-binding protein